MVIPQGLRIAAISGVLGTCLGAWIKCFSVQPDLFWVGFIGQSIVAASQVFILSLPAKVAAVWFGPDQVSSACSIGVFGNQASTYRIQPKLKSCHTAQRLSGYAGRREKVYSNEKNLHHGFNRDFRDLLPFWAHQHRQQLDFFNFRPRQILKAHFTK